MESHVEHCKCGKACRYGQRQCLECHAEYMRKWRKAHPLTEEQRRKDICRSYLSVYVRRGKVQRQRCKLCGREDVEALHRDYSKPLEVEWICRLCRYPDWWLNPKQAAWSVSVLFLTENR